jgi:hypothetical protein
LAPSFWRSAHPAGHFVWVAGQTGMHCPFTHVSSAAHAGAQVTGGGGAAASLGGGGTGTITGASIAAPPPAPAEPLAPPLAFLPPLARSPSMLPLFPARGVPAAGVCGSVLRHPGASSSAAVISADRQNAKRNRAIK